MDCHLLGLCLGCGLIACGASSASGPNSPSNATKSQAVGSKQQTQASEVSKWSQVPQNEPASQRSVIGKHKTEVLVVSDPSKHGDTLHFQFTVNSVVLSGVFSAPGGQSSTFTLPTGSVQFTVDECRGDAQYFDLNADEKVTIKCELTTEGDCCYPADDDEKSK